MSTLDLLLGASWTVPDDPEHLAAYRHAFADSTVATPERIVGMDDAETLIALAWVLRGLQIGQAKNYAAWADLQTRLGAIIELPPFAA